MRSKRNDKAITGEYSSSHRQAPSIFEPGSGVLATEGVNKGYFVDAWGNPFKFILDTSGAQSVLNPDPEPDGGEPTEIPERVIAWSSGKDRVVNNETGEQEWNDNPKSWW